MGSKIRLPFLVKIEKQKDFQYFLNADVHR